MMLLNPRYDKSDLPAVVAAQDFAEARVMLSYGQPAMLYMPLTEDETESKAALVRWIRRTSTPIFDDCQFFKGEMLFFDEKSVRHRADIILQRLPEGNFLYMPQEVSKQRLREMLDELQIEMQRLNITHTNLTPSCIIVGKRYMHITRVHQLQVGKAETNFRPLYTFIDNMDNERAIEEQSEWRREDSSPIKRVYDLHEERVRIMMNGKYGFTDVHQNIIVNPEYLWADDFTEGRAVVRAESGAGVIDRCGEVIIPPRFENIFFDVDKGFFRAVEKGVFYFFNYDGELFDTLDEQRFGSDVIKEKSLRDILMDIKKEERKQKRRQKRELQREIQKILCKEQNALL